MTEPGTPNVSPDTQKAMALFAAVIGDPQKRAAFVNDPKATLHKEGVPVEYLPEGMVDNYGRLGLDGLTVIAKHCEELVKQGFYIDIPGAGRLCLF